MEFSVGETLRVDGDIYQVLGKIRYKNLKDNCYWFEYRLRATEYNQERWLSIDDTYREYTLSKSAFKVSTTGYHQVDDGVEEVVATWGDVDVAVGDTANFVEYEDSTEEKIISVEVWSDGEETTVGYYLDADEISKYNVNSSYAQREDFTPNAIKSSMESSQNKIVIGIFAVVMFFTMFGSVITGAFESIGSGSRMSKYIKKSYNYTYVTSLTGNEKQKADVYSTALTMDNAAKDIIDGIDGDTENVQQNTEDGDNSIAILTKKEYCLIYTSEDNQVLVQVSPRKYVYTTDSSPYRSRSHTHRYYRRHYYSTGYTRDTSSYKKSNSSYASFDDTPINVSYSDSYNSYSNSVRQTSVNARSSSGGGISSGK